MIKYYRRCAVEHKGSRNLRESQTQKRRSRPLQFRPGFTGGCILLFAEEIPESNAAPDVHTVMIASVFARTEDLSRCRWYTTPHGIFSAPSRSNSLPTVKSFTTFVPCKRRLRVLTSPVRLSTLGEMTGGRERNERKRDIPPDLYLY